MTNSLIPYNDYDDDCNYPNSLSSFSYPIMSAPESPETTIARRRPLNAIRLLDRESKRRHYNAALAIGADIARTYLSGLPMQERESYEVTIEPEANLGGFFFRSKGMVITFNRGGR